MASRSHRVVRNSAILAVVFALNALAGSATTIILGHALSVEALATYGTWFRAFAWLGMLAIFLVPPVLLRYSAELSGAGRENAAWSLLRDAILCEIIIMLVLFGGFSWFAGHWLPNHDGSNLLVGIVMMAAGAFAVGQVLESFLRGLQQFAPIAGATALASLFRLVLLSGMLLTGGGAALALGIYALGQVVMLIVLAMRVRGLANQRRTRKDHKDEAIGRTLLTRMADYGFSMGAGGILSLVIWHYPEVFFIGWLWEGREGVEREIAWYTLAIGLAALPLRLGKILGGSLLPAFADVYGSGDPEAFRRGYHRATVLSAMVALPIAAVLIASAPVLVRALFPESLHGAALPFQLVMIPAIFMALHQAGGAALPALEGHRFYLLSTLALAPICILLNLLLVPRLGAVGAGLVNAIAQSLAVGTGIYYVAIQRRLGFPVQRVGVLLAISLLVSIIVHAALLATPTAPIPALLHWGLVSIGAAIMYLLMIPALRLLDNQDATVLSMIVELLPSMIRPIGGAILRLLVGARR